VGHFCNLNSLVTIANRTRRCGMLQVVRRNWDSFSIQGGAVFVAGAVP